MSGGHCRWASTPPCIWSGHCPDLPDHLPHRTDCGIGKYYQGASYQSRRRSRSTLYGMTSREAKKSTLKTGRASEAPVRDINIYPSSCPNMNSVYMHYSTVQYSTVQGCTVWIHCTVYGYNGDLRNYCSCCLAGRPGGTWKPTIFTICIPE